MQRQSRHKMLRDRYLASGGGGGGGGKGGGGVGGGGEGVGGDGEGGGGDGEHSGAARAELLVVVAIWLTSIHPSLRQPGGCPRPTWFPIVCNSCCDGMKKYKKMT